MLSFSSSKCHKSSREECDNIIDNEELLSYIKTCPPLLCIITASNNWKEMKVDFTSPINTKCLLSIKSLIYDSSNSYTLYQKDYTNRSSLSIDDIISFEESSKFTFNDKSASIMELDLRARYHILLRRNNIDICSVSSCNNIEEVKRIIIATINSKFCTLKRTRLLIWLYANCISLCIALPQNTDMLLNNKYNDYKKENKELVYYMYSKLIECFD